MRIAYIVSTLERCGPVNVLFDIVAPLAAENEIVIFTLAKEPENTRQEDFKSLGINTVCLFESRLSSMIIGFSVLRDRINDFHPDIVHVHGFRATLLSAFVSCPTLVTVHNCLYEDYAPLYGWRKAQLMTKAEALALKRFDAIVACSSATMLYLRDRLKLKAIVVRNGVDQSRFFPAESSHRREIKKNLGIPDSVELLFVATGGCSVRKGTLEMIKDFNKQCGMDSTKQLHILGSGALLDECVAAAGDNVFVHGFTDDIVPWLQSADVFVSYSKSEGMPLGVLEALSCGCSAVLSAIPSHEEIKEVLPGRVYLFSGEADYLSFKHLRDMVDKPERDETDVISARRMSEQYYDLYQATIS